MRFIGHLDVMHFFQRLLRRSDIPIAYSGGFSPHQIMSFALPLGIGLLIGFINGMVITRLRIVPFIATLAVQMAVRGLAYIITGLMGLGFMCFLGI